MFGRELSFSFFRLLAFFSRLSTVPFVGGARIPLQWACDACLMQNRQPSSAGVAVRGDGGEELPAIQQFSYWAWIRMTLRVRVRARGYGRAGSRRCRAPAQGRSAAARARRQRLQLKLKLQ